MHGKHGAGVSLAVDAALWTVWPLMFVSLLNAELPLSCLSSATHSLRAHASPAHQRAISLAISLVWL
jgi:hypothetical protein